MILMYIDPGTGSMLFTILIGIFGTVYYVLRLNFVKFRMWITGGRKGEVANEKLPLVIFSDSKRYWNIFEPICKKLNEKKIDVTYYTASPDDPALSCDLEHVKAEFIGENNRAFSKLNFLKANIVFSTTPGLDVYQWKRSKDVDEYVHILHAANDATGYRMFGTDYYDAVLVSGQYHIHQIREMERIRNLPKKEVESVGIPYMDVMLERLQKEGSCDKKEGKRTILLAPSWGPSAILNKFGARILEILQNTGYEIIVRPHPQSFTSEKDMIDKLMKQFPESENFHWNRDNDNFEVLRKSDILISDFSGVVFDFALVYDKPIIYADVEFDDGPYDAWWLDEPYWTFTALPRLGEELNQENIEQLKTVIDTCIDDPKYAEGRNQVRSEAWEHMGEGAQRAADFLEKELEKYKEKELKGEEK